MSVRFPVSVKSQIRDWSGSSVELVPAPSGEVFELWDGEILVATCGNAKALSAWALDKGAKQVRWDFDLAISEKRNE